MHKNNYSDDTWIEHKAHVFEQRTEPWIEKWGDELLTVADGKAEAKLVSQFESAAQAKVEEAGKVVEDKFNDLIDQKIEDEKESREERDAVMEEANENVVKVRKKGKAQKMIEVGDPVQGPLYDPDFDGI